MDPDNRLVAAELEAKWNATLNRLQECEAKTNEQRKAIVPRTNREALLDLANDFSAVWNTPTTDRRTKQRLIRALIEEIVVDVDDSKREVVLVIHWRGGQHSELHVRKPLSGEHSKRAPEEVEKIVREMATRWSDNDIAATLNRMALPTGHGKTWNAIRVAAYRRSMGICGYESATKDGHCLTMFEAAAKMNVTCHAIRKLIKSELLPARQVVFDAPWQIQTVDLERPEILKALRGRQRTGRPCRNSTDNRTLIIPGI